MVCKILRGFLLLLCASLSFGSHFQMLEEEEVMAMIHKAEAHDLSGQEGEAAVSHLLHRGREVVFDLSASPTRSPTLAPTADHTTFPSFSPTVDHTAFPSFSPSSMTEEPTVAPTWSPSLAPTRSPTASPSRLPTVAPTRSPSAIPSVAPTATPSATRAPTTAPTAQTQPVLTFSSSFTMAGLTSATLSAADQEAVLNAQAEILAISVNYIVFVSATAQTHMRHVASVEVTVITQTTLPLVDFPQYGGDATSLYQSMTSTLSSSVADGSFSSTLTVQASNSGSTNLATASVSSVDNSDAVVDSPDDDGGDKHKKLSDGAIAGIVIGCVVFVALFMLAYYYCFSCSGSNSKFVSPSYNQAVVNPSAHTHM
eukprot:gene4847-5315_t